MSKLLLVDDEMDIREFARNFFKKRSINVFTASSGEEALEIIRDEGPDLVLLDVRMDGMTGLEVLKKLRSEGNNIKVVMVTGVEEEETLQEAESLGVVGYVHKPLVLDELEKIVMGELKPTENA